jgi:hypothetical protein
MFGYLPVFSESCKVHIQPSYARFSSVLSIIGSCTECLGGRFSISH